MNTDPSSEEVQRWTAKRKAAVVLDLIAGKTTSAEVARSHGLTLSEVEQWKAGFIAQGTESLRSHPRDQAAQFEAREQQLLAKVGDLALQVDILKKSASHTRQGLAGRDLVKAVHHDLSQDGCEVPWTKLCAVIGVSRSTAYYEPKERTARRVIDPVLAARIKELIETQTAFGIRSVWSWLRFVEGLQINRKKVEGIMRLKGWTLKARRAGQRPRVAASRSIA